MPSRAEILATLLLLGSAGTAQAQVQAQARSAAPAIGYGDYAATGTASWYGEELLGNRTASGDRFDPDAMTAAHRSLPLGSFVEVVALDTGRAVLVRVNDRGPGRKDRLIDLSRGAARSLGIERRPLARVRVRAIVPSAEDALALRAGRAAAPRALQPAVTQVASNDLAWIEPKPVALTKNGVYVVQVASFSNRRRAQQLADRLGGSLSAAGPIWRVRLGPFTGGRSVQDARDAVAARGYGDARILPLD